MLETLLNDGWDGHADDSAGFADALEAAAVEPVSPALLVEFLRVATHTIGEHLGDWPRAVRLGERVLAPLAADSGTAKAWAYLWVAQTLSDDDAAASATELTYLAAAGANAEAARIEARFLLVAALVGSGRAGEAAAIYEAALDLADAIGEAAPDRAIAVASNNLASELVEQRSRTDDETALMRRAADTARAAWLVCGTWLNDERSTYLLALVANARGEPAEALAHAEAALAVIEANGEAPVDATFLHLARANALRLLGEAEASAAALSLADDGAEDFEDSGLAAWYAEERARAFGG